MFCTYCTLILTFNLYRSKISMSTLKLWYFSLATYGKIYGNFHTLWVIFNLHFGKKFKGPNICAKTLIFGRITLDILFLARDAAIFNFWSGPAKVDEMAKKCFFQLLCSQNNVKQDKVYNGPRDILFNEN